MTSISALNKEYWQHYAPGKIPSVPKYPPDYLLSKGDAVLDVGTGDGTLAEYLSLKGCDVTAIDIAKNIIDENTKKHTSVKYSVQDITRKTTFPDNYFDLIVFKFVLTNIHKESWDSLQKEVLRILKVDGKIWILEPLISPSYEKRYALASNYIEDKSCVYVFTDPALADTITTKEDLKKAIAAGLVSRIIKHFEIAELESLFRPLKLQDNRELLISSPSGFDLNTLEGVFRNK